MADELRGIIESVHARLQAELEGQLRALDEKHQQTLVEARRAAEAEGRRAGAAEAEQALAARLQAAREEAVRRAQETVAAVRAELERERVAEVIRVRTELEQRANELIGRARAESEQRALEAATQAAARVRAELEDALSKEREQAKARVGQLQARLEEVQSRVEADKRRASEEIENARAAFDAVRAADRAAHEAARTALEAELASRAAAAAAAAATAAPVASGVAPDRLAAGLRDIDAADSLSATLAAIAAAAAKQGGRSAVFVASGEQLREWEVPGAPSLSPAPLYVRDGSIGVIGEAVKRRELVRSENGGTPSFAGHGVKSAVAAPLLLDGQPIGVVYGDSHEGTDWADALHVIASHGSARLGYITAVRTAQAMRWVSTPEGAATLSQSPSSDDGEQAARRYARLLISEIKLYNEGAVRVGRENRDLMRRLADEIQRARRLFEERVPASVATRGQLFHQELVHTLAGGDASLLG